MSHCIDPKQTEIVIVGHTRHQMLKATLGYWEQTCPGYRSITVICNHPTTMDTVGLPERAIAISTGRIPTHPGYLSENWNLGLLWTFHQNKDTKWVILSQDDVRVSPGWLEIVNKHEADFYNAPAGDMIMLISRHAWRTVGWFDEHIRTIGGQDLDWIARAVVHLGPERIVSEDHHGWCYNAIGLEEFWESAGGKWKPGNSYAVSPTTDKQMKDYISYKWGMTVEGVVSGLKEHKLSSPKVGEFDWYPWCSR